MSQPGNVEDDSKHQYTGVHGFTYQPISAHLYDFFSHPWPIVLLATVTFGVLWTFTEAAIGLGGGPQGWISYTRLLVASVCFSLIVNGYRYYYMIPEGLEGIVSPTAAHIAHRRRPAWQYHFAKAVLAEKLGPIDRELRDLKDGRAFVVAEKPATFEDYWRWSSVRIKNLERMSKVAMQLIVHDFPAMLVSTEDKPVDLKTIVDEIGSLKNFYREIANFERTCRAILTSDELRQLHQYQLDWSDPIRDAIHKLFVFLQQVCDFNSQTDTSITFAITLDEPANVALFIAELARLEPQSAKIKANWNK